MSYEIYKIFHLLGVFFVFAALGGLTLRAAAGQGETKDDVHKIAGRTHGAALLIIVISGFGMLARLGIEHDWMFPGWVWAKLAIWLALGGSLVVIRKQMLPARVLWVLWPALGAVAAGLVIIKPW